MNFFFEKIPSIFDIENWLWKYDFGTFWRTIIHCRIVLKQFPLSMLILVQKAWILRPTIFKIPPPNWHYCWGHPMLIFWKLVDETQMSKPQNIKTTFKQNITCIFLSIRLKLLLSVHCETPCITSYSSKTDTIAGIENCLEASGQHFTKLCND